MENQWSRNIWRLHLTLWKNKFIAKLNDENNNTKYIHYLLPSGLCKSFKSWHPCLIINIANHRGDSFNSICFHPRFPKGGKTSSVFDLDLRDCFQSKMFVGSQWFSNLCPMIFCGAENTLTPGAGIFHEKIRPSSNTALMAFGWVMISLCSAEIHLFYSCQKNVKQHLELMGENIWTTKWLPETWIYHDLPTWSLILEALIV